MNNGMQIYDGLANSDDVIDVRDLPNSFVEEIGIMKPWDFDANKSAIVPLQQQQNWTLEQPKDPLPYPLIQLPNTAINDENHQIETRSDVSCDSQFSQKYDFLKRSCRSFPAQVAFHSSQKLTTETICDQQQQPSGEFPLSDAEDLLLPLSSATDVDILMTLISSLRIKLEAANFNVKEKSKDIMTLASQRGDLLIENQQLKNALQLAEQHVVFSEQKLKNFDLDSLRGQALSDCSQELANVRLMYVQKQKCIMELKQEVNAAELRPTSQYHGLQQECLRLTQERNQAHVLLKAGKRTFENKLETETHGQNKQLDEISRLKEIIYEKQDHIKRLSKSITDMADIQKRTLEKCKRLSSSQQFSDDSIKDVHLALQQESKELEISQVTIEELRLEIGELRKGTTKNDTPKHIEVLSEKHKREMKKLRQKLNKEFHIQLDEEKNKQIELNETIDELNTKIEQLNVKTAEFEETQTPSSPFCSQKLIKDYKVHCNELVEQLRDLAEEHQNLEQHCGNVQTELEEQLCRYAKLKNEVVSLRCQMIKLEDENEDLISKLEHVQSRKSPKERIVEICHQDTQTARGAEPASLSQNDFPNEFPSGMLELRGSTELMGGRTELVGGRTELMGGKDGEVCRRSDESINPPKEPFRELQNSRRSNFSHDSSASDEPNDVLLAIQKLNELVGRQTVQLDQLKKDNFVHAQEIVKLKTSTRRQNTKLHSLDMKKGLLDLGDKENINTNSLASRSINN